MELLRIGVIGTGHMGRNHVRNLVEERRFHLVGIFDKNMEQAEKVAERYSVKAFDNLDSLLSKVDAVVIAVPSSMHREIGIMAARHKVHALIEKPLALNSEDAKIIADEFEKNQVKLAVGHIERFNPVVRELVKLVKGEKIINVEARRYSPFSGSGRIEDTSVIEDLMIHDVDLVCHILKNSGVTVALGIGEKIKTDQIDFATCVLKLAQGGHAVVSASRVSQNKERVICIHAAGSCIYADLLNKTLKISKNTDLTIDVKDDSFYKQDGIVQKIFVPNQEPLRTELIAFYDAIVNDVPVAVDGKAGIRAIEICEEVVKQANFK